MRKLALYTLVGLLVCAGSATAAATITGSQVKNSSLTGKDVKNKSLTKADFKGSVRGPQGLRGAAGTPGPAGAAGPAGPAGPSGVSEIVAAQGNGTGSATALCPAGTRPLSGGGIEEGDGYIWASAAIRQDDGQTGWAVIGNQTSPMTAFAYCSAGVSKITFPNGTVGRSSKDFIREVRAKRG